MCVHSFVLHNTHCVCVEMEVYSGIDNAVEPTVYCEFCSLARSLASRTHRNHVCYLRRNFCNVCLDLIRSSISCLAPSMPFAFMTIILDSNQFYG